MLAFLGPPRRPSFRLMSCLWVAIPWTPVASAATRVPIVDRSCELDAAPLLLTDVSGITYDPALGGFAMVDRAADEVVRSTDGCGAAAGGFSTASYSTSPSGIAYIPTTSWFAIVDDAADLLVLTDVNGVEQARCATLDMGAATPVGVAFDPLDGTLAIVDSDTHIAYFVDPGSVSGGDCLEAKTKLLIPYGPGPSDITYVSNLDAYAILNSYLDLAYVVDRSGYLLDQFELPQGIGSSDASGIAYSSTADRYFVADPITDDFLQVDARGTVQAGCPISSSAKGLTFMSNGDVVVVDDVSNRALFYNPATCTSPRPSINLAALGVGSPTGVAYVGATDQLAITDTGNDELWFLDSSGGYDSSCDTTTFGMLDPSGVDYVDDLELLVVTNFADDAWVVTDLNCNVLYQHSAGVLSASGTLPQSIAFHPPLGNFVIADSSSTDLYLTSFEGTSERRIDTGGLGLGQASAVATNPFNASLRDTIWLADPSSDTLYALDIPALLEPLSLSGRFLSSRGAEAYLFERGEGKFTGTMFLGTTIYPLFGEYRDGTGTLTYGSLTPTGKPIAVNLTVSADLKTISGLPPQIGVLTRQN